MMRDGERRQSDRCRLDRAEACPDGLQLGQQRGRLVRHVEAEQLLELAGEDDDGDAGREADGDREGDVLDVGAEPQEAGGHHHQPGHQGRQHEAIVALALDDRGDEHDEGAGRSADLEAAAAEGRDQEAADDGGEQALVGRQARADGDGHRQRQRHDGDRQAGDGVGPEIAAACSHRAGCVTSFGVNSSANVGSGRLNGLRAAASMYPSP